MHIFKLFSFKLWKNLIFRWFGLHANTSPSRYVIHFLSVLKFKWNISVTVVNKIGAKSNKQTKINFISLIIYAVPFLVRNSFDCFDCETDETADSLSSINELLKSFVGHFYILAWNNLNKDKIASHFSIVVILLKKQLKM